MLGGMRKAISLELIIRPRVKELLYPASSSMGRMVPPMAATVAWVDPETAPKSVQLALVVMGRPPGRWPTKTFNIRIRRMEDSPEVIMLAERMNMGTHTRAGGVTPVITCCTMVTIIFGAKSGI